MLTIFTLQFYLPSLKNKMTDKLKDNHWPQRWSLKKKTLFKIWYIRKKIFTLHSK